MTEENAGTKKAERLMTRPDGATMDEIVAVTGGPQYNVLRRLEGRGYRIRKVKEGRATRYFAAPPASPSYVATVTSKVRSLFRRKFVKNSGCSVVKSCNLPSRTEIVLSSRPSSDVSVNFPVFCPKPSAR